MVPFFHHLKRICAYLLKGGIIQGQKTLLYVTAEPYLQNTYPRFPR